MRPSKLALETNYLPAPELYPRHSAQAKVLCGPV